MKDKDKYFFLYFNKNESNYYIKTFWTRVQLTWLYIYIFSLVSGAAIERCSLKIQYLIVYSCHVTYAFQSQSTPYSCLNVKELLARSRREIWRWSDCNWTGTQNQLVLKRTRNHLSKLAMCGFVLCYLTIHRLLFDLGYYCLF